MGLVCAFFAVALALVAWRTRDASLRWAMSIGAALNAAAVLAMWLEGSPNLLHLLPPDNDPPETNWRR